MNVAQIWDTKHKNPNRHTIQEPLGEQERHRQHQQNYGQTKIRITE